MKYVLDSASFLAALTASQGASRQLLSLMLEDKASMLVSVVLWRDYEKLCRQTGSLTLAGLDQDAMDSFLASLYVHCDLVPLSYGWKPVMRDPHDDLVLATAVTGGADMILTLRPAAFGKACSSLSMPVYSPGMAVATGMVTI